MIVDLRGALGALACRSAKEAVADFPVVDEQLQQTFGPVIMSCSESAADIRDSPIIRVRRSDNGIEVL